MKLCTFQLCESPAAFFADDPHEPDGKKYACQWHHAETIRPTPGVDRPPHASEFWRPSLFDMTNLARMTLDQEEKPVAPAPIHRPGDERYTPEQLRCVMAMRRVILTPP